MGRRAVKQSLNGLVTVSTSGPGGFVRSARAALRTAAKQVRATLPDRTVARVFDPPLNEVSPFAPSYLRIRVGNDP